LSRASTEVSQPQIAQIPQIQQADVVSLLQDRRAAKRPSPVAIT
jgi:hypothetical protein